MHEPQHHLPTVGIANNKDPLDAIRVAQVRGEFYKEPHIINA